MASAGPRTPIGSPTKKPTALLSTDSPGNWSHPRLAEITQRKNATIFSDKNVRAIVYNVLALAGVFAFRSSTFVSRHILRYSPSTRYYIGWATFASVLIILYNIGMALLPLFRTVDPVEDIPLTAAQRRLLGLPPSSVPPTPGSVYSTPPRYSRTPSLSGSAASNKSFGGHGLNSSPLSGKGSPAGAAGNGFSMSFASSTNSNTGRRMSGSPFSPGAPGSASPLLHKVVNSGRKASFGSPGPLLGGGSGSATGASLFGDVAAGTPSPSNKRTSVSLNSKWLYEKGRRSSGSAWVH